MFPVLSHSSYALLLWRAIILLQDVNLRKPCVWVSWNSSDFEYGRVPKTSMSRLPHARAVSVMRAEGTQRTASGLLWLRDVTQRRWRFIVPEIYMPLNSPFNLLPAAKQNEIRANKITQLARKCSPSYFCRVL